MRQTADYQAIRSDSLERWQGTTVAAPVLCPVSVDTGSCRGTPGEQVLIDDIESLIAPRTVRGDGCRNFMGVKGRGADVNEFF